MLKCSALFLCGKQYIVQNRQRNENEKYLLKSCEQRKNKETIEK